MKKVLLIVLATIASSLITSFFWGGPPDGPYENYYENGQLQEI